MKHIQNISLLGQKMVRKVYVVNIVRVAITGSTPTNNMLSYNMTMTCFNNNQFM